MFLDREEKEYVRPYILIENGVLKKYIADESGIVNIPDNVETIGEGVFSWVGMPEDQFDNWESENEQRISKIHIPASVKRIEPGAFVDTFYLQDFTIDPKCPAAELIDGILFSKDKKRVIFATSKVRDFPEYRLPTTVKVIDKYAFWGKYIANLIIPPSVEEIGEGAFAYYLLNSVTIPDSIKHIGEGIFAACNLDYDRVILSESNPVLKKDEFGLYTKDGQLMINAFYREDGRVEVPAGVRAIEGSAFSGIEVKEVVIPEGVHVLRDELFYWSRKLESVVLPDSLTGIGENAFMGCGKLKKVKMSANLAEIHSGAFKWCEGLEIIELPATLKSIGEDAFAECEKLVIHAPAGSYAITYAKENKLAYKEI